MRIALVIVVALLLNGCSANDLACQKDGVNCSDLTKAEPWQIAVMYEYSDPSYAEYVENVISHNNGFNSVEYFPTSLNILINKAITKNEAKYYDLASDAANQLDKKYGHDDSIFGDYKLIVEYLKSQGEKTSFMYENALQCDKISSNYSDVYEVSFLRNTKQYYEYSMWYGLYANNGCSNPMNRAMYIASLIELDSNKALPEFNRILNIFGPEHGDSIQFKNALCALKERAVEDSGDQISLKLENTMIFDCIN